MKNSQLAAVFLAIAFVLAGCNNLPTQAENGVLCYEGSFNAPWNASARANGVTLDADVDVTTVTAEEWIQLYEAFCRGQ